MVGSTETADGKKGFVPAPDKGPPNRFLNSSGIWTPPEGGSADTATKALQDGDGNVISGTYVRADGGVLNGRVVNWRSSRSSGARGNFIRFCKISTYRYECSMPVYITLLGKGQQLRSVLVDFVNTLEADPALKDFKISGQSSAGQDAYIAKEAAGIWRLFVRSENWDWLMAVNSASGGPTQPGLEFETTIVSSLPTGAIAATEVASIL